MNVKKTNENRRAAAKLAVGGKSSGPDTMSTATEGRRLGRGGMAVPRLRGAKENIKITSNYF